MTTEAKFDSAMATLPVFLCQSDEYDHRGEDLAPERVREQLARILSSTMFASSARLSRFLQFVVEANLSGEAHRLKEYVIGTEVYDRRPPYHPSQDSIVRTEARRLRTKLKEYYGASGEYDPVFIYFRPGSYIPVFSSSVLLNSNRTLTHKKHHASADRALDIVVRVFPFEVATDPSVAGRYARNIAESLSHRLISQGCCQVIASGGSPDMGPLQGGATSESLTDALQLRLHGTVARHNNMLSVSVRLMDQGGLQICSLQFDIAVDADDDAFALSRQIASAIASRLRIHDLRAPLTGVDDHSQVLRNVLTALPIESLLDQDEHTDWSQLIKRLTALQRADPFDARVLTGIANCLVEDAASGAWNPSILAAKAKEHFQRAIDLDSELGIPHAGLGLLQAVEGDFEGAAQCFREAFLRVEDPVCLRQYGLVQIAAGDSEDGWHAIEKAHAIDPFARRQRLARARALYLTRRFEQLVSEEDPLPGVLPLESRIYRALAAVELGQLDWARQEAHYIRREAMARPQLMAVAAEILARTGDREFASRLLEEYGLISPVPKIGYFRQAILMLSLDKIDCSAILLKKAIKSREPETLWASVDPRLDPLRNAAIYSAMEISECFVPANLGREPIAANRS